MKCFFFLYFNFKFNASKKAEKGQQKTKKSCEMLKNKTPSRTTN